MTDPLLRQAWSALGGEPSLLDRIEVIGNGVGLLPSRLAALPAMVAAVSAATLGASVLDAARQAHSPESVVIDVEHVAVAACSERYARMDGSAQADLFAPLSRFWRTADGWLRLHANYPWHQERALKLLGCENRPDAVGDAIRSWQGHALEDALAEVDALGSAVRTRREWQAHPQGSAVATQPLVDTMAGGRGRAATAGGRWADGLRVVDLTRVIAGPVATRTLAAWGADVLRLDSPHLPEIESQALDMLPGKRSALLDVSGPPGRARLEELLAAADVLVQGYRPGALARYGLASEELSERHPHLSVVTLSAWGREGPWAARRGFDSLVQCSTGIAEAEGSAEKPGALPAQVLDHATGYLAAAAALLALAAVQRGEPSRCIWLSLAQTAHWLLAGGLGQPEDQRAASPDEHLLTLPGAARPVHVIAPVGRVGDRLPAWTSTTELGADPPSFATETERRSPTDLPAQR